MQPSRGKGRASDGFSEIEFSTTIINDNLSTYEAGPTGVRASPPAMSASAN